MAIVIVFVIKNENDKKNNSAQGQIAPNPTPVAAATNHTPTPINPEATKEKERQTQSNIALYVGFALIVIASLFFSATGSSRILAITDVLISIILYVVGLGIYKSVDYLKPVGKWLCFSGIAMTLSWGVALTQAYIPSSLSSLVCLSAFTAFAVLATIITESRGASYASGFGIFAICFQISAITLDGTASFYLGLLLATTVSALASLPWYTRARWLPVCFRKMVRSFARGATPCLIAIGALLEFILSVSSGYSISNQDERQSGLFCLILLVATVQYLFGYFKDHSANKILALRIITQLAVLAGMNYLCSTLTLPKSAELFIFGITLLSTSVLQLAFSVFIKASKHTVPAYENIIIWLSILNMFTSNLFFAFLAEGQVAIVRIICYAIVGLLGLALCLKREHTSWISLFYGALMLIPVEVGNHIIQLHWEPWIWICAYTVVASLIIGSFRILRDNKRLNSKELYTYSYTFLALCAVITVMLGIEDKHTSISWLLVSAETALITLFAKRKQDFEICIYTITFCIYSFMNEIFNTSSLGENNRVDLYRSMIAAHILAIAPLIASIWKEREMKEGNKRRLFVAYGILTAITLRNAFIMRVSYGSISLAIFFLIEQVILMVIAIILNKKWLCYGAIGAIFAVVFYMSIGYGFLWLFVIGFALIGGVCYQLIHQARKQLNK